MIEPMPEDDEVVALLRAQGNRERAFRGELVAVANRLRITQQVATKLDTILSHRLWHDYHPGFPRMPHDPHTHTLAQLLERRHRYSITQGSQSWRVLRAWLEEQGHSIPEQSDGRPRCDHCGALLKEARA